MADIAFVASQDLDQLFMTTGYDASGAVMVCQQPSEHLLLQSGHPLRRHRFSPPASLQCSLYHSHTSRRSHHRHATPTDRPLSACWSRRCGASRLTEERGERTRIVFQHGSATDTGVYVGLSDGAHFAPAQKWNDYFCVGDEWCAVADVNGDGKADIIVFQHGSGTGVYVGLSDGARFAPAQKWNDYFCVGDEWCAVADVNGDGKADIIVFQHGSGTGVYVGLSDGARFAPAQKWNDYFCVGNEWCAVADVDGSRLADVLAYKTPPPQGPR